MIETCLSNPAINCSFYLFQYGSEVVEINLVGALFPLLVSAFFVISYRRSLHWLKVGKFVLVGFAIITAVSSVWSWILGGLGLPGWLYILFWLLIVIWYSRLRFVRGEVFQVAAEVYVVGTLGVFLDDAVRTLLGFGNFPILGLRITPNIWGAGGLMDGIFMTGMYQAIFYLLMIIILRPWAFPRSRS
jgi:uncharacterized membrane protein